MIGKKKERRKEEGEGRKKNRSNGQRKGERKEV